MRPPAEDGNADAFQIADDKARVVARDPGMGEAGQIGIVDGHPIDRAGKMAEPRAKDKPQADRRAAGPVAHQRGQIGNRRLIVP